MTGDSSNLLDTLFRTPESELFGVSDVFLAMTVSALLCFVLSQVYRYTHRGTSYSQSFMVTLFAMAVCTAVVMMIIGSNIARAFSLVGALSIIRFRTAVKDPRDTGYLFAAMIAGMGCGSGFYLASIAMTIFVSALMLVLYATNYGLKHKLENIVRVTFRPGEETLAKIEAELERCFRDVRLINRILEFGDGEEINVYVVSPGRKFEPREIEGRLAGIEGVVNLSLYQSDQHAAF